MEDCLFCAIAAGSRPADIVLEEPPVVAFLDHRPLFPGHVLLIPRRHISTLDDLPDDLVGPVFSAAQRLSRAVRRATGSEGTFVAMNNIVSQSVPHLHVHVVPRRRRDGLRGFFWPRHGYEDEAHRGRVAAAIRKALESA
jgi:histidine triad (HIT) family protein